MKWESANEEKRRPLWLSLIDTILLLIVLSMLIVYGNTKYQLNKELLTELRMSSHKNTYLTVRSTCNCSEPQKGPSTYGKAIIRSPSLWNQT